LSTWEEVFIANIRRRLAFHVAGDIILFVTVVSHPTTAVTYLTLRAVIISFAFVFRIVV
jgi:hypothetical protein